MNRVLAFLRNPKSILIALVSLSLLWFCLFPIALLVLKTFQTKGGIGLDNFVLMYSDPGSLKAMLGTLQATLLTMLASLLR